VKYSSKQYLTHNLLLFHSAVIMIFLRHRAIVSHDKVLIGAYCDRVGIPITGTFHVWLVKGSAVNEQMPLAKTTVSPGKPIMRFIYMTLGVR